VSRAFSARLECNHGPGGDASGYFDTAPLARNISLAAAATSASYFIGGSPP